MSASFLTRAMSGPAHVGDVLVLVADLLDREGDDLEAHLVHVAGDVLAHPVGHHLRLLDDLLDRQLADDAAQVALHRRAGSGPRARPASCVRNCSAAVRMLSGSDLTLIWATASTVTATPCVVYRSCWRRHVERHQLERELVGALDHRQDDAAAAR